MTAPTGTPTSSPTSTEDRAAMSQPAPTSDHVRGASIVLDGVSKTYVTDAGRVQALTPTDLRIEPAEFVVLLGPSGCGKTTLLRMLAGLLNPTSGTITIGDKPLHPGGSEKPSRDALGNLGFVFQQATLMPWRSVWKNIALPLEARGISKADRRARAEELAAQVGLSDFLNHRPGALSGGMQQRVAIARALARHPSILLMDEPFGALDAMTRDQMNTMLQDLWLETGKTIVLVTHSITEAVFLADRIVLLSPRPGRVQEVIEVPMQRPRSMDVAKDPAFGELVSYLRRQLGEVS